MVKQFYDIVVIGAGPAGIECAKKLADNGKEVVLIDKHIGGNYCSTGSVISNILLHISYLYERTVNKSSNFVDVECDKQVSFDFKKAKKHVDSVTSKVVKGLTEDLESSGVIFLKGFAVFEDAKTLRITDDKLSYVIGFNKCVLAVGSSNLSSNVPTTKKLIDTSNIFDLVSTPKSVVIVGGGFIGTEFATFFKRIGSHVTIIEKSDRILCTIDRQVIKEYEEQIKKNGIDIIKDVSVQRIEKVGNKTLIFLCNDTKVESEEVFVSVGRKPNIAKLLPDNAGIRLYDNGVPKLTKKLRSSNRDIYIIGDTTGVNMFVNWAYMSAEIAANDILGVEKNVSADFCPRILHLDPQIAAVGINEDEAKSAKLDYKVIRHIYKDFENSIVHGTIKGYIKIIYEDATKRILGCHAVGGGASELVSTFSMMIQSRISLNRLEDFVFNHPTFSGVLGEIAGKIK